MPAAYGQGTQYTHITTATTTTIAASVGPNTNFGGTLVSVTVNTTSPGGTITIYDSATASGAVIAIITVVTATDPFSLPYNIQCKNGLTIVTSATTDVTIGWF